MTAIFFEFICSQSLCTALSIVLQSRKYIERRLSAMETNMLRCMAGITRLDCICNQDIRQRFGVAALMDKLREAHLRWYGRGLRGDNDSVCNIGFDLGFVPGKRPKRRQKQRWVDTLHADLEEIGIHPDQAHETKRRQRISRADTACK
ncbi:hypothetical protein Y032_0102g3464 [Ancylostoma ceylanicum]|uniref:Uncharacterized protein n=1 Tax=Ancylostoma ceylanicum TaxID=53326 RepID=A0A016THL6_9BILA|nr:hypothetical protein Y032_0102g3464 [Ancylostoma ceylanicum]